MKLIDADKLRKEIPVDKYGNIETTITKFNIALEHSAIDAEPVRHGHWIDMVNFEQCSVCKATHLKGFNSLYGKVTWVRTAYCPNCGAKMDEKIDL